MFVNSQRKWIPILILWTGLKILCFFFLETNVLEKINKDHYIGEYEGMVDNLSVYNTLIRENARKTELYDINSAVFANNTLFLFDRVALFSELQEKYKQLQTLRKNFIELQKQ